MKRGCMVVLAWFAIGATHLAHAGCPPFYPWEESRDWPAQYDLRALDLRLGRHLLDIQRGLAIGQITPRQAQPLIRENSWLRVRAFQLRQQALVTPQQWQGMSWNLDEAWRHIQQSRRDCGY